LKASNALAAGLASALETGWQVTARSNQLPPDGDWSIWLLLAGRGFGKTRVLSEMANARASSGQTKRIAIVAATAADTRDVMVEGESGILATAPPWCVPVYQSTRRRLEWPNGALAYCYSAEAGSAAWPAARRRALRRARLVAGPECVGHVDVRAATRKAPQDSHREYAAADQVDPPVAVGEGKGDLVVTRGRPLKIATISRPRFSAR